MRYRNVGALTDLADGRIIERGQEVELSKEDVADQHNRHLIDAGRLVEITKSAKEVTDAKAGS